MNGVKTDGKLGARVPRYHRIAEALRERIGSGELAAGGRLHNQRKLAQSFGVTLITLRQAPQLLQPDHLITRRHGPRTLGAAPPIDYDNLQPRRVAADPPAQG